MKKKILFLIYTEMQFIICYLYYLNYFNKTQWTPYYMFLPSNENRFRNMDFSLIEGNILIYRNQLNSIKFNVDKEFLSIYEERHFDHILLSNPGFFINYSIVNFFLKGNNDLKLTVVSDGVGITYYENLKYHLKATTKLIFHSFINRVPNLNLKIWTYRKLLNQDNVTTFISNLPISNPSVRSIITNDLLLSNTDLLKNEISSIFNYNQDSKTYDLLFYTQYIEEIMPKTANEIEEITGFVATLALKYKKRVLIKIHPSVSTDKYTMYKNEFVDILENSNLPGEILLINQSIKSFSFYSSVGYVNDKNYPAHYWLYPMIKKEMDRSVVLSLPKLLNKENNIILISNYLELEKLFEQND